jgi:hypothetical protein
MSLQIPLSHKRKRAHLCDSDSDIENDNDDNQDDYIEQVDAMMIKDLRLLNCTANDESKEFIKTINSQICKFSAYICNYSCSKELLSEYLRFAYERSSFLQQSTMYIIEAILWIEKRYTIFFKQQLSETIIDLLHNLKRYSFEAYEKITGKEKAQFSARENVKLDFERAVSLMINLSNRHPSECAARISKLVFWMIPADSNASKFITTILQYNLEIDEGKKQDLDNYMFNVLGFNYLNKM